MREKEIRARLDAGRVGIHARVHSIAERSYMHMQDMYTEI